MDHFFAKRLSTEWVMGAMSLTAPSAASHVVICNDDCENCPLFKRGCAKNCVRWDDLICKHCPCLASKYADSLGNETKCVEPKTNKSVPTDLYLLGLRVIRKTLDDGEDIPSEFIRDK